VTAAAQKYRLCSRCAERQGGLSPSFEIVEGPDCSVCSGMMDHTARMAELAARRARRYQFESFTVGVSLPDGVQEREDELRSNLKLKGNETIKTQAARLMAAEISHELGKRVNRQRPDLTVLADFGSGDAFLSSRPLYYYARYTKPGKISQKRSFCEQCHGAGCEKCGGTGFERKPSVEGLLRKKLSSFTGSERMTFTWLGSEDRESRVLRPGRPFLVEIKNPEKRKPPGKFGARIRGGLVSVTRGRVLPSKPVRLPAFRFRTRIEAVAAAKVTPEALAELKSRFRGAAVRFDRPHSRPTTKTVYRVSATAKGRTISIDAELDGGLPVKRFVSGELVSPSVSEVLKTEVGCRSFDICGVKEIGRLGFAEITRGEEKD
jgi:tRNA pseudouridine synthase 10